MKKILQQRGKKQIAPKILGRVTPYQIILAPLMTEKSYKQVEADKKYHFKVHKDANKNDVKLALSKLYSVTPLSINLVAVPYKGRANRKLVRRAYKKAIVTLQEGQTIDFGE